PSRTASRTAALRSPPPPRTAYRSNSSRHAPDSTPADDRSAPASQTSAPAPADTHPHRFHNPLPAPASRARENRVPTRSRSSADSTPSKALPPPEPPASPPPAAAPPA